MASITDPIIQGFNRDYLRPLSEVCRDLLIRLSDAATEYTTNIQTPLATWATGDVEDSQTAQGITAVSRQDMEDLIAAFNSLRTELDTAGEEALRAKFTVRPVS
jgi:hypothetical protein